VLDPAKNKILSVSETTWYAGNAGKLWGMSCYCQWQGNQMIIHRRQARKF